MGNGMILIVRYVIAHPARLNLQLARQLIGVDDIKKLQRRILLRHCYLPTFTALISVDNKPVLY
jgi:hypothetical protein